MEREEIFFAKYKKEEVETIRLEFFFFYISEEKI